MNELNTLTEQTLEEFLFDVSSVSKYLSIENLGKYRPHSAIPVIYVCTCKTECYHFTGIITKQMQFESMAHQPMVPFPFLARPAKTLLKSRLTL